MKFAPGTVGRWISVAAHVSALSGMPTVRSPEECIAKSRVLRLTAAPAAAAAAAAAKAARRADKQQQKREQRMQQLHSETARASVVPRPSISISPLTQASYPILHDCTESFPSSVVLPASAVAAALAAIATATAAIAARSIAVATSTTVSDVQFRGVSRAVTAASVNAPVSAAVIAASVAAVTVAPACASSALAAAAATISVSPVTATAFVTPASHSLGFTSAAVTGLASAVPEGAVADATSWAALGIPARCVAALSVQLSPANVGVAVSIPTVATRVEAAVVVRGVSVRVPVLATPVQSVDVTSAVAIRDVDDSSVGGDALASVPRSTADASITTVQCAIALPALDRPTIYLPAKGSPSPRNMSYSGGLTSDAVIDAFQCAFCLDTCVEPATTPCGHFFCFDHLREWVTAQSPQAACPVCRTLIQQHVNDVRVSSTVRGLVEAALHALVVQQPAVLSGTLSSTGETIGTPLPPAASIPYDDIVFERNRRGDRVELGRGAFASVFRATFRGEPVAVKCLVAPPGASAAALTELERAFVREAALLYHVRHEGVVQLMGTAVDREAAGGPLTELALVMPRFARSLEAAVAAPAESRSELAGRLGWLQQVARALRFLHASGIVHGDLKPANVLLDASGGRALVCDFGHARLRDGGPDAASLSLGGGAAGTPRYRDPAVAAGHSLLRKASDVFSFGILAWHVLAGRTPFEGLDVAAVLAHTVAGGRPDPDAMPSAVPGPLRVLLSRCWWPNQNDRPTAAALVERLEAADCRITV